MASMVVLTSAAAGLPALARKSWPSGGGSRWRRLRASVDELPPTASGSLPHVTQMVVDAAKLTAGPVALGFAKRRRWARTYLDRRSKQAAGISRDRASTMCSAICDGDIVTAAQPGTLKIDLADVMIRAAVTLETVSGSQQQAAEEDDAAVLAEFAADMERLGTGRFLKLGQRGGFADIFAGDEHWIEGSGLDATSTSSSSSAPGSVATSPGSHKERLLTVELAAAMERGDARLLSWLFASQRPRLVQSALQVCSKVAKIDRHSCRKRGLLTEGILMRIIAALTNLGCVEEAEEILRDLVNRSKVRMRSFIPLLEHYATTRKDQDRLWELYQILEPLSTADTIAMTDEALGWLLVGFDGQPDRQHAVLSHFSMVEFVVPIGTLRFLLERLRNTHSVELWTYDSLLRSGSLPDCAFSDADAKRVRKEIEGHLGPETVRRLGDVVEGGADFKCVMDGANVGFRGASARAIAAGWKPPFTSGTQMKRNDADGVAVAVEAAGPTQSTAQSGAESFSQFFRYDQIQATIDFLEEAGEAPLVILPERYTWTRRHPCPSGFASPYIRGWLEKGILFVVPDWEYDDFAWTYAALHDNRRGLFVVTCDEGSDHKAAIWGFQSRAAGQKSKLKAAPTDVELQTVFHRRRMSRAWRRWKTQRVRLYTVNWTDDDNGLGEVKVHVQEGLPSSHEAQCSNGAWYLPDEAGLNWLVLRL